jgi:hypothetical protein
MTSIMGEINSLELAEAAVARFPFLHLFPVEPGNKAQPLQGNYLKLASNDPEKIRRWHKYWTAKFDGKEIWWGVAPELSGLVFADVDTKEGKRGQDTFEFFELLYGWPATLETSTPSGGRHHWYRGRHLFAVGRDKSNHPGIDFAQFVILPGCMKADGTGYSWTNDAEIADAPDWFYVEAKRTAAKTGAAGEEAMIELDQPDAIAWAEDYLRNDAPASILGQGGEATMLKVAMALREMGISESRAVELINDIYNAPGLCDPEWEITELTKKVANGYAYASVNAPGQITAEAEFFPEGKPETTPEEKAARVAKTEQRRAKQSTVAKAETLQSLKSNYVYIGVVKRFLRESDALIWDPDAFNAYFSNIFVPDKSPGTPIGKWLLSRLAVEGLRRYETMVYHPGKPRTFNGNFNLYTPPDLVAVEGNTALWDAHLAYLFPDPVDRNHVLNWMAWLLQNLGKKPKHALLVHGEHQGTGKSFIADVLVQLLGKGNCYPADQDTLERQHNGWAMRTKLVVCEEVRSLGHYNSKAAKQLHTMITQERTPIDEKNMPPFTLDPNLMAFFLMTNSLAALRPDDGDRRYLMVSTPAKPKPDAYYFPLFDILEDPAALAAIKWQLETRDLAGYSGIARAPMTAAKAAMTAEASSDIEQWMTDNAGSAPLCYGLVNITEIVAALPRYMQRRETVAQVRDVLRRKFNGVSVKEPIRPDGRNGDKVRVWATGSDAAATAKRGERALLAIWREDRGTRADAAEEAEEDFGE